jgi:hypothetical protein
VSAIRVADRLHELVVLALRHPGFWNVPQDGLYPAAPQSLRDAVFLRDRFFLP